MAGQCKERLSDYFAEKGNKWLIVITLLEVLYYLVFTVIYILVHNLHGGIVQLQIYRWAFAAVLVCALGYFLWHSVSIGLLILIIQS
jgi:hypothetical protein